MKRTFILLLTVMVAGCGRDKDSDQPRASGAKPVSKAVYPEEDVVAIMRALDSAEIATSRIARDVSQNDEVLRYASIMIQDHSGIMRLAEQTGPAPRENAISGGIRREADSVTKMLNTLPEGFNNTYIEAQVKAHERALKLMDSTIIPSARDTAFRNLVLAIRPTIAAHLQRAMQLLAQRKRELAERGEAYVSGRAARPATPPMTAPAPTDSPALAPARPDTPSDTVPTTTTSNM
jgi:putative membrane protein